MNVTLRGKREIETKNKPRIEYLGIWENPSSGYD